MKCFICNKKITWSARAMTSDWKWICPDDINKILLDAHASKWGVQSSTVKWIQNKSSDELKRMIDNQVTFTLKGIKAEKSKEIRERSIPAPAPTISSSEQRLTCPQCGSTNIQPLGQHKKGFSVGKAVGGTILTGGVGALAGFAGKKTKQTDFVCMNCGKQFKK